LLLCASLLAVAASSPASVGLAGRLAATRPQRVPCALFSTMERMACTALQLLQAAGCMRWNRDVTDHRLELDGSDRATSVRRHARPEKGKDAAD
jgi:hypothetical protein